MADKNIQMTQRNAANTDWDNIYPITKAENVKTSYGSDVATELADMSVQIDNKANQTDINNLKYYSTYKLNKDSNGIYTEVQFKRQNGTLIAKSVLSGGTSPNYTTRIETFYTTDGITADGTYTYTRSYDVDGNLTSEVMQ